MRARLPPLAQCPELQVLHKDDVARRKICAALTCLGLLLRRIHPEADWTRRVAAHLTTFPATHLLSLESAGFGPDGAHLRSWR